MQSQNHTSYFVVVEIAGALKRPGCTNDWGGPHARMAHLPADYVRFGKECRLSGRAADPLRP